MKRLSICLAVAFVGLALASLRLRPTDAPPKLPEAIKKAAFAKVARAWSNRPALLAAGWGKTDLPMFKLSSGPDGKNKRTARPDLPPRLSVLVVGQPFRPQMALITAEILSVPKRTGELIRAYASEILEMPPARILVVATHTHAGPRPEFGPALRTAFGEPEFDERSLAAAVAYAADQAKKCYQQVESGSASTEFSTYIANRSPGASSPVDTRLRALRLNAKGRRLLLWSYAAHPTLVARNSLQADGDYPARVAVNLEEKLDFDQVMFVPGRTAHATVATERNPDLLAVALTEALLGLDEIAKHNSLSTAGFAFEAIELPKLDPRIPFVSNIVAAPWLHNWLGSSDIHVHLLRIGRIGMTFVSGEVSNGLVPSTTGDQWVVSLSGSGLGYLVDPRDRSVQPEQPLVLLGTHELSQMGELLRIVAGSLSRDRLSE